MTLKELYEKLKRQVLICRVHWNETMWINLQRRIDIETLKKDQLLIFTDFSGDSVQRAEWEVETMKGFTGSEVMIDEDQTYDVKVQFLWIGL